MSSQQILSPGVPDTEGKREGVTVDGISTKSCVTRAASFSTLYKSVY